MRAPGSPWPYADALELLLVPGWPLVMVDMVLEELNRSDTPTSQRIATWVAEQGIPVLLRRCAGAQVGAASAISARWRFRKRCRPWLSAFPPGGEVFLFEDHKIARASFLLPAGCSRVTTRAWLLLLERQGWLESAAAVERRAIAAGRLFARLRFPSD